MLYNTYVPDHQCLSKTEVTMNEIFFLSLRIWWIFFFSENNILKSKNTDIIKTTDFLVIVSQCFFVAVELVLIFSCFTKKF